MPDEPVLPPAGNRGRSPRKTKPNVTQEEVASSKQEAAPHKRGPHKRPRPQTKQQVTVRIDKRLLEVAAERARNQGLTTTDAIEAGLWLYLGEEQSEATTQLRFLAKALSTRLQKQLLACAGFLTADGLNTQELILQKAVDELLVEFLSDRRCVAALERLASPLNIPPDRQKVEWLEGQSSP